MKKGNLNEKANDLKQEIRIWIVWSLKHNRCYQWEIKKTVWSSFLQVEWQKPKRM